ncbi:MAG: V-type ATP synthase subunit E family protein [Oscillospiraceae bacterium]
MDLNAINASKISRFQAAVDEQADKEIAQRVAQIRERNSAAGKIRAQAEDREELAKIRAERNAAETRIKKELSRCDFEIERAVLSHRKELIDGFFEELKDELAAFAASDKYEAHLKKSLEKATEALGKEFVVLAKAADIDKVKVLTQNEVRVDVSITIGGICAMNEDKGLFADFSLDSALDEEREAFVSKKELTI